MLCKHWTTRTGVVRDAQDPAANPRAWIAVHGILYLDRDIAEFV